MAAILDFRSERFWLFLLYKSPQCFLPSFKSIGLSVQGKKRKIDFQDGDHGGHLGFLIGTILTIFLTSHPDSYYQVLSQLVQGCRRITVLKQLLTPHDGRCSADDGRWLATKAHLEHVVLRWANKTSIILDSCGDRKFFATVTPVDQDGHHAYMYGKKNNIFFHA